MEHPDYLARVNGGVAPGAQGAVVDIRPKKAIRGRLAGLRPLKTGEPS